MKVSPLLRKGHEEMIALYKRMKPEEKLMAFFNHSQLMNQLYQAGVGYHKKTMPSSIIKKPSKKP